MRRKPSAAGDRSESPTEQIARISAEHDSPTETTGRHRRIRAVVTTPDTPTGHSLTRRMAPLAIGVVVMLVTTAIVSVVRPAEGNTLAAPELGTTQPPPYAEVDRLNPTSRSAATTTPEAVQSTTEQAAAATKAAREPAATTTTRRGPAAPGPAAPAPSAPASRTGPPADGGDGTQTAVTPRWTAIGGDEFNGSKSSMWNVYQGAGHAGEGRRTAEAITVENGSLVIRGDPAGNTGGLAWGQDQRFGKWEMRARFPKGDSQYHPVLLLWPNGSWPAGGEIDLAETDSAATDVSFFLHYSAGNQQKYAKKAIDLTQWHIYAVEWVDGRVTGYMDGAKWFESTDPATMPSDKMHAAIQLDYFPDGGSPQPTEMYVDYLRIYE